MPDQFQIYRRGPLFVAVGPDHAADPELSQKGVAYTAEEAVHLLVASQRARTVWRRFGVRDAPTFSDFKLLERS